VCATDNAICIHLRRIAFASSCASLPSSFMAEPNRDTIATRPVVKAVGQCHPAVPIRSLWDDHVPVVLIWSRSRFNAATSLLMPPCTNSVVPIFSITFFERSHRPVRSDRQRSPDTIISMRHLVFYIFVAVYRWSPTRFICSWFPNIKCTRPGEFWPVCSSR